MKNKIKLAAKAVLLGVTLLHMVLIIVSIAQSDMTAILGHMIAFLILGLVSTEVTSCEDIDQMEEFISHFITNLKL